MGGCVSSASSVAAPHAFDWGGAARKTKDLASIAAAKKDIAKIVKSRNCGPIFVRASWHELGEYDKVTATGLWS